MNPFDLVIPLKTEKQFNVPEAVSVNNKFKGYQIPQNPWMAPNDFGSPHQDSWCSESVSMDGPTKDKLELITRFNPFGYMPNMVCNSKNQMIGVSLHLATSQFWLVVFTSDCDVISATPLGKMVKGSFGGGYFYLDNDDNTVVVSDDKIISFPTQNLEYRPDDIYSIEPNWTSDNIVQVVTGSPDNNTLYTNLPIWNAPNNSLYWCLIAGSYDYEVPNSPLVSPAYMAVVQVESSNGVTTTTLVDKMALDNQWNNNTFAVDENGAYIVTNGLDKNNKCNEGYIWAFGFENNEITVRWKSPYKNAGYLKPGQKNIGSGTTPTLTETKDGRQLVGITDNADPQLNVCVYDRMTGKLHSETPCFEKMRSADEASLIGVGDTFIVENNFGHYPTYPLSQYVPNGPGMSSINIGNEQGKADTTWTMPNTHFYAMNMLCRGSGIIFAHTCDWSDDISATKGGMYYISAIDSFNGHVIWRIPLGRGVNYCHEYGGIYFNHDGDLFIGTNQYIISIKNFHNRSKLVKIEAKKMR